LGEPNTEPIIGPNMVKLLLEWIDKIKEIINLYLPFVRSSCKEVIASVDANLVTSTFSLIYVLFDELK
jgi:hypothetical protein